MKTISVRRKDLKNFLKGTGGKFFGVTFVKKDGSLRKMNARVGVKKYLKGGENKVEAPDRPYVTVFDVHKKGYRTVNVDTVQEVHYNGLNIKIED
jgi:hypothetical protein